MQQNRGLTRKNRHVPSTLKKGLILARPPGAEAAGADGASGAQAIHRAGVQVVNLKPEGPHWFLYFLGVILAAISLRALILRRWRAKCSLSKTHVTFPSAPVFFT
jgi:hypothetical protein